MEYWKQLLKEHRKKGKSGLTIPFIIGSQFFLPAENKRQDIRDLIIDIVSNDSFETCIRYCFVLKTLILEIKKNEILVVYPTFKKIPQKNLSISIFNKNIGGTVEEVIINLTNSFQNLIESKLFSVKENDDERDAIWGDFSDLDKQLIEDSFKEY